MDKVYIGKIVNTHGIKGEVRILSNFLYKDKAFKVGTNIIIDEVTYKITSYRKHKQFDMVTLDGFNDINQVLFLMKKKVYKKRNELKLNSSEILDEDLIKYFDDRIRNTMIECENYIKYDLGGKGHYSQQDRMYFLDKKAPTVPRCRTETKFNVWLGGEKYKKTCPVEIERLQTLPDNYTEYGMDKNYVVKKMPKTRRFEAIGNGWTVDVIAWIFESIKQNNLIRE